MSINISIKRKFKINGKEYNSIKEMPSEIQNAFEKTMASKTGTGSKINLAVMRTKIIFNGTEYNSIEAMPQDVRQLYEKLLKAAETGVMPADIITAHDKNDMPIRPKTYGTIPIENMGKSPKFEPTFSLRTLIIGALLIALIILLYIIIQSK